MTLVTFALPQESSGFLRQLALRQTLRGGALPWLHGRLGGLEVFVVHTGVGEFSARGILVEFLANTRPTQVVSAGFAGGLDPGLRVGDAVIADNRSDETWAQRSAIAVQRGQPFFHCRRGILLSQSKPAVTPESKNALGRSTDAVAVDMETAAIHQICVENHIPTLSLRVISDAAGDALPLPFKVWFNPATQRPRPFSILFHLAKHPRLLPVFGRFVAGVRRAEKVLSAALPLCLATGPGCEMTEPGSRMEGS